MAAKRKLDYSDDRNLVMYSTLVFQSADVVERFCEFFQKKWEIMQADNQHTGQPIVFKAYSLEVLPDTMDQRCNAILFVFNTSIPWKLALQVKSMKGIDIFKTKHYNLNVKDVNDQLCRHKKPLLPPGSIDDLGPTHAKLHVYVFKFDNTRACSEVSSTDVIIYEEEANYIAIPTGVRRNVAWSFYSLDYDATLDIGKDFKLGQLMHPFVYPQPATEKERMDPLLATICQQYQINKTGSGIKSKNVSATGDRSRHCEFTGGGNIHLQKKGKTLVIYNNLVEVQSLSPECDTESVSSLVIEEKLSDNPSSLTYQLIANTILCCVEQFINECKDKEHDETFLKEMTKLSGYGVPYTGAGYVGFYKLTIEFNRQTKCVAKVQPGVYDRPISAAYVDYALEYFLGK